MTNWRIIITVLFCVLIGSVSVEAQSKKQQELEAKRQQIIEEIKQINSLLFKTRGEKKSVLNQVEDLDQRIRATENLIRVTNQQANLLTREINDNLRKIESLRDELKTLKEDYAAMIRKSYRSKSQQSRVMFLLSSDDFLQAYKRLQYMKQYAKHRKAQGDRIKEKTEQLQLLNTGLLEQKKQKQLLIDENKRTRVTLAKEKKDQEALIASLRKDEGKFASQIRTKQKEADAIDRQIDAIIRAAIAESNKSSETKVTKGTVETFALTAEAKALAANFSNNKGKLPWPVEKGVVIRRYGNQRHPQLPNVTTFSSGVEIATEKSTNARAVFDGVVFQIQKTRQGTKAVYIRHGSYISVYYNMDKVTVKTGDKVKTKQAIGTIFTNGLSGKTVLKFLIYQNSTRMNPADWVYRM
ncbi:peptidoglycan DD-metalloendopeptidase family protein [Aureitalea sp. L0-47]|uniref:murein hydrolase activator EnvC family protein n=1 Tax=Aureitalea sp. L0-47 TaxID=2816962 RepID=UPI002237AAD2|nr:peptidoglycan DD-metalloendopeptidase family protein [Aureitalea sp. L0-47]MCW5519986.1 peptidoglycan DD-metalloendopeptidase family protein [Aureitalea sp. L0-47]